MSPTFILVVLVLVLLILVFIKFRYKANTPVSRADTYSLSRRLENKGDVDTYILTKNGEEIKEDTVGKDHAVVGKNHNVVVFAMGDGVRVNMDGLKGVYYELNIFSLKRETSIYTIPYIKSAEFRIPNDLEPGEYHIYVNTPKGTVLPEKWFTRPIISFGNIKSPEMVRVRSYKLDTDNDVYYELGDKFKEIADDMYPSHNFLYSLSSKRETYEKSTTMIVTESLDLDLEPGQTAVCILPNRSVSIDDGIVSTVKVNGESIKAIDGSKFIHFKVTGKTNITETMFGNHYSIKALPFYSYIFSTI